MVKPYLYWHSGMLTIKFKSGFVKTIPNLDLRDAEHKVRQYNRDLIESAAYYPAPHFLHEGVNVNDRRRDRTPA